MSLFIQFFIGGLLTIISFAIQALCFDQIIRHTPWIERKAILHFKPVWKAFVFIVVVTAICGALILEIWLWALFYLEVEVFTDLETALYFSTSSFTTVGFGDVYLDKEWRMISAIESMNGFMLFGWTTAFIWEIVTHLYRQEGEAMER